jgi:single-strand DNA-binding protein
VATFSVATNRVWKDKAGARQEAVDYHNVVVFGRQAETVSQYLKKGSGALVEGRMQTRSWDGADGQKKYRTEIVADHIQFGPRSGNAAPSTAPKSDVSAESASSPSENPPTPTEAIEYPEEEINPDDIPF